LDQIFFTHLTFKSTASFFLLSSKSESGKIFEEEEVKGEEICVEFSDSEILKNQVHPYINFKISIIVFALFLHVSLINKTSFLESTVVL